MPRMTARLTWLALVAALLLPALALAQMRMELVELKHRRGQELLPAILPLLAPHGGASAHENKIVLRAGPGQLKEARALLARLDLPPRQFLLTVRVQQAENDGLARDAQRQTTQQLRLTEGKEAQLRWRHGGSHQAETFAVLPRLQGDRVQLEIRANSVGQQGAAQRTTAVVIGPLGDWFDLRPALEQLSTAPAAANDAAGARAALLVRVQDVSPSEPAAP